MLVFLGSSTARTHTNQYVVNKSSRYQKSAGLDDSGQFFPNMLPSFTSGELIVFTVSKQSSPCIKMKFLIVKKCVGVRIGVFPYFVFNFYYTIKISNVKCNELCTDSNCCVNMIHW